MILDWIREVGPWSWMVLGVILLALEIVVPGVFLLWIGVAAILTGALSLQLWGWESWIWQVQVLVFLALSLAAVFVGRRIMRSRGDDSDQPLLNRRAEQLVGRTATLSEAIVEGRGRVRLGDTMWRISGRASASRRSPTAH
jgi:inner membrane protein